MLKQQKIFFDFLRFCIGSAKEIPDSLKKADWKELYAIAQKQALLGVLFHGIRRLPKKLAPEAETADAMDGDGGNDSETEHQTISGFREGLPELRKRGL